MTNEEAKTYWLNHESVKDKEQSEAVWKAINALEKQIPRKLIEKHYEENGEHPYVKYSCPCCDNSVSSVKENKMSYQNRFCNKCGQKLDWSDEDGE